MGHNIDCMCILEVDYNFQLYKLETNKNRIFLLLIIIIIIIYDPAPDWTQICLCVMLTTLLLSEYYQAQITTLYGSCSSLGQNAVRIDAPEMHNNWGLEECINEEYPHPRLMTQSTLRCRFPQPSITVMITSSLKET